MESNPEIYPTLQSIVLHEAETKVSRVKNSVTFLVEPVRRYLKFLKEFLSEVNMGQQDIQKALSKSHRCRTRSHLKGLVEALGSHMCCMLFRPQGAYERSLWKFHPWLLQATFNVSISLPSDYFFSLEVTTTWLCFFFLLFYLFIYFLPRITEGCSILSELHRCFGVPGRG